MLKKNQQFTRNPKNVSDTRRKSVILAHMGVASAKMGDAQGAYDYACQSLAIIAQTHSLDTLQRIQTLRDVLFSSDEHALVKDLDQHIRLVQQEIVSVQVHSIL